MLNVLLDFIAKKRRSRNPARILRRAECSTAEWYHRGYHWVCRRIVPALYQLEQSRRSAKETDLLVDSLYVMGDHCLMNSAPVAATQWYARCLLLDPRCERAYKDLAHLTNFTGEDERVLQVVGAAKAHRLSCVDELNEELDLLTGMYPPDPEPLYFDDQNEHWMAREFLAMGFPRLALRSLYGRNDVGTLLHRARIFGAMDRIEDVLETYRLLADSDSEISMYGADVYYLSHRVLDEPMFWEQMKKCVPRMKSGPTFDRVLLREQFGRSVKSTDRLSTEERQAHFELIATLEYARVTGDLALAKSLSERFPKWTEARKVCDKIKGTEPSL